MTAHRALQPLVAVVGIGPGNGESLVRRFHDEGYQVAILACGQEAWTLHSSFSPRK